MFKTGKATGIMWYDPTREKESRKRCLRPNHRFERNLAPNRDSEGAKVTPKGVDKNLQWKWVAIKKPIVQVCALRCELDQKIETAAFWSGGSVAAMAEDECSDSGGSGQRWVLEARQVRPNGRIGKTLTAKH